MLINSAQDLSGMALNIDTIHGNEIHSVSESVDSAGSPRSYQSMSDPEQDTIYEAVSAASVLPTVNTQHVPNTDAGDFASHFLTVKP